jgi:hypothetical protein
MADYLGHGNGFAKDPKHDQATDAERRVRPCAHY